MKKGIKSKDLYEIQLVDDAQISPCGEKIAYVRTRLDKYDYISNIIVIDAIAGELLFSIEDSNNAFNPIWNKDGSKLAYISNKSGSNQIWIYDTTGYAYQLTTMKHGVKDIQWSPVKDYLYFLSESSPEENEYELVRPLSETDRKKMEYIKENEPIHIKDIVHKYDGIGLLSDRKTNIWEIDANVPIPRMVTDGYHNFRELSISRDGRYITYISDPIKDLDFRPQDRNLWITDLDKNETRLLIDGPIYIERPTFSKDAKRILFVGHEAEYGWGTINKFYIYDIDKNAFECISKDYNISIGNTALSDLRGLVIDKKLYWDYELDEVYFQTSYKGNNGIYKLKSNREIELVLGGQRNIYNFSIDKDYKKIALCYTTPTIPNDIAIYDQDSKKETNLTSINEMFLKETEISLPEEISITSLDGLEIQGWILKPAGFNPNNKYPLILEIHGGPQMMYSNSFMFEFQLLCSKGYVVYYSNPRGSSGYTQEFMAGIQRKNGGIGAGDYEDLMNGVDYVESLGYVDKNNMGVTGGSFGGFMTNWVVGHTNRFKAAVTQRSISNWYSFQGVSDYGYCDSELAHQIDFFEEFDEVMKISPITYVKNIDTPLLILHSEHDLRCPLEQAQQLFTQLKLLKKETELVVFPKSSHGLSRNGIPHLRIKRLDYIINWFKRYLG